MKPKERSNFWVLCVLWMYLLGWNCHCDHSEMESDGLNIAPPKVPLNHVHPTPLTPPDQQAIKERIRAGKAIGARTATWSVPVVLMKSSSILVQKILPTRKSTVENIVKTDSGGLSALQGASDGLEAVSDTTTSSSAFQSSETFSGSEQPLSPASANKSPVDASATSVVLEYSSLPSVTGSLSPSGSSTVRQTATEPIAKVDKIVPPQPEARQDSSPELDAGTLSEQDQLGSHSVSDAVADDHKIPAVPPPQGIQEPVHEAMTGETQGTGKQMKATVGQPAEEQTAKSEESRPLVGEPPPSEVMPSFDEWKKMMLAEQEKGGQKVLSPYAMSGKKILSMKRRRNYASYECGAKIVSSNPEAESTGRILNELVDEYMLNPCIAKIWFVIELCESIQASQVELANFELFSSSPKEFTVYWSDRFPTREWTLLGSFLATDQKTLQAFDLNQQGFGKFIKVEMGSHYGTEHYCPLSVVRVFGASMVEEYEELETQEHTHPSADDEEDDHTGTTLEDLSTSSTNLFGSARDAVLSIVKKAAQAWTRDQDQEGSVTTDKQPSNDTPPAVPPCESSSSDSTNCTKLNKTPEESQDQEALPAEELDPSLASMESSVPELPLPQLQQCILCTSVPKVDEAQSHSEPDEGCRFLQAALGPDAYDVACEKCRQQVQATFIAVPSLQHPAESSGCQPITGSASSSSTIAASEDRILTLLGSNLPELSASDSATSAVHMPSTDTKETTSSIVQAGSIKPHSAAVSTDHASREIEADTLLDLQGSIQPTKTIKDPSSPKPDKLLKSSVITDPSSHFPVGEISLTDLESSSSLGSGESSTSESTEVLPNSDSTLGLPQSISDSSLPADFQGASELRISHEQVPSHKAPEPGQQQNGFPTPYSDVGGASLASTSSTQGALETSSQSRIVASKEIPDELFPDEKIGKSPPLVPTDPLNTWTTVREPGIVTKDPRNIQPSPTLVVPQKSDYLISGTALPPGQKESVFMRLSNRLKALELNMSLSSQYLEELSQRYRRQMEEMQRAFNRTVGTLNDTARKTAERDLQQQETIGHLEAQLANISMAVDVLLSERHTLHTQLLETHLFLIAVEVIVLVTVLSLCVRRMSQAANRPVLQPTLEISGRTEIRRRNSANDSLLCSIARPSDLRRHHSSDDTLHSGSYQELMIIEPAIPIMIEPPPKVKKKNRSKKNKGLVRSASTHSLRAPSEKSNSSQGDSSQPEPSQQCISSAGVLFTRPSYHCSGDNKPLHNGAANGTVRPFTDDIYPNAFASRQSDSSRLASRSSNRDLSAKQNVPNRRFQNGQASSAIQPPAAPEKFSWKKLFKSF